MKRLDQVCAWVLFWSGVVHCALTPRLPGRLWFFGTGLALMLAAMINLLRIRNGYSVPWLRQFCLSANAMTLVLAVSLFWSLLPRAARNPQVLFVLPVVIGELIFSLRRKQ